MALILAETATNLSTTNGFYRVEAYQQDFFSASGGVAMSSGTRRNQTMTFANSGNLRGIIIGISAQNAVPAVNYVPNAVVELHEAKAMTVTIASPAVVTSTTHGLSAGQTIQFSTTGALPTGITANTTYYVIATGLTTDSFRFSTTLNGSAVNTSGSQSGTQTLWVVRASKTRTLVDVFNNTTYPYCGGFIKPFKFDTPYPVDTTASKWRFQVQSAGSGIGFWLSTDYTNAYTSYFAWCDTQVSFSNGNDTVIAAAPVTIDMTATFKGILYTVASSITYAMCAFACTPDTPTYGSNGMFLWQMPTLASYTLTLDGQLLLATQAGLYMRSLSPIKQTSSFYERLP